MRLALVPRASAGLVSCGAATALALLALAEPSDQIPLSALLALRLVEDYGWRSMFVVGGALGLLTLPFMWAKMTESAAYLRAVERRDRSAAGILARSAEVVKGPYLRISIGLCVASFMGLLLVYGLNTWLPTIMRDAGYSIQQGTTLILVLNVGAVMGLLVAGHISDTRGNKPAVLGLLTLATVPAHVHAVD